MKSVDAVVVGAGIAGMTVAYFLTRERRRVLVIDSAIVGAGGSGRNGGHISPGIEGTWADLGLRAYELWPALARDLGDVEFRPGGGLYVVMAHEAAEVSDLVAYRRQRGFVAEEWTPSECLRALPVLDPTLKGGVFSPKTAQVNPQLVIARLEDAVRQAGGEIQTQTGLERISITGGAIDGVRTDRGETVSTAVVVNAAGPGADAVGTLAGIVVPVRPSRIQMIVSEAMPRITDMVWSGNGMYARQAVAGQLHFGAEGPAWDPPAARRDNEVTGPTLQRIAKRFVGLTPGLRAARALRSWAGVLGVSIDGFPIIDAATEPRGLYTIAGMGGNGFATGAVAGKAIAASITGGQRGLDLAPYSLARFDQARAARQRVPVGTVK